jgi:hypothetical protein
MNPLPSHRLQRRALMSGLAATMIAPRAWAAEHAGEVESAKGECFATGEAVRRTLAPNAEVFVGDSVGTGTQSALAIRLGTATRVRLGQEAQLRIDRYLVNAGGTLVLERGGMVFDHDSSAGPTDVSIRSPFGLIAVRGTRLFAGPSNGVFGVFVERGAVTVVAAGKAVLLIGGLGTNIAQPGAEPTAPAPWGAARIAAAMASVT